MRRISNKEGFIKKTLSTRISTLFVITLISAVMVFSFISCQNDPDPNPADPNGLIDPNKPVFPEELQNTKWRHNDGDIITFSKTSVTLKTSSGQERTFSLKNSYAEYGSTSLFFNDDQTDQIAYQGVILFVNLGDFNKTSDWRQIPNNPNNPTLVTPPELQNTDYSKIYYVDYPADEPPPSPPPFALYLYEFIGTNSLSLSVYNEKDELLGIGAYALINITHGYDPDLGPRYDNEPNNNIYTLRYDLSTLEYEYRNYIIPSFLFVIIENNNINYIIN